MSPQLINRGGNPIWHQATHHGLGTTAYITHNFLTPCPHICAEWTLLLSGTEPGSSARQAWIQGLETREGSGAAGVEPSPASESV